MSDILEQIGITKEELIERIVNKALGITAEYKQTGEETWSDIPLSDVVDKKIEKAIGNLIDTMKPMIQGRIEKIMDEKINQVFSSPFQPVDCWGEKKGKETSIRELIAKQANEYWTEKVNSNGEATNSSYNNTFTRAEIYAKKVMTEHYEKELKGEVSKMAQELRNKIPQTIASEITGTVLKYLK